MSNIWKEKSKKREALNLIQTYTVDLLSNWHSIYSPKKIDCLYYNKALPFRKRMKWNFEKDTVVFGYSIISEKGLCYAFDNFHNTIALKKGDCLKLNFSDTIIHGKWTLSELCEEFEENEMSSS